MKETTKSIDGNAENAARFAIISLVLLGILFIAVRLLRCVGTSGILEPRDHEGCFIYPRMTIKKSLPPCKLFVVDYHA